MSLGTSLNAFATRRIPRRAPHSSHVALGVVLFALSLILPLASACLPDPPWAHGVYDDGDHDTLLATVSDLSLLIRRPRYILSRPSSGR